jgi:hypothetical protein
MRARRDIQNWWAVQAMIASYNHVYSVVYDTTYHDLGAIGVSAYGNAPIAAYQNEFFALDPDPQTVVQAIRAYPQEPYAKHVLNVFFDTISDSGLTAEYEHLGYEPVRSGPLLGLELGASLRPNAYPVRPVKMLRDIELANQSLADEGEYISPKTLRQEYIHTFIAEANGQAAGWAQMVTIHPKVAYLNQLFVMKGFRRGQMGSSLLQRAQMDAAVLGMDHMVLIPSDMAAEMVAKLGYQALVYFTALRPRDGLE